MIPSSVFFRNPRKEDRLMNLHRRAIWLRIPLELWDLLYLKFNTILPCPSCRIEAESEIPDTSKSQNTPSNSWGGKPCHCGRALLGGGAVRWNPRRDNWVSTPNRKDSSAHNTKEGHERRLLTPPLTVAESELKHTKPVQETKDGDDSVGVKVYENSIRIEVRAR